MEMFCDTLCDKITFKSVCVCACVCKVNIGRIYTKMLTAYISVL